VHFVGFHYKKTPQVHTAGLILKDLIFMKQIFVSSVELLLSVLYASVVDSEQQLTVC
jgi:hypothetical protein